MPFTENLNKLRPYVDPSGQEYLSELIDSVAVYDKTYIKGDLTDIAKLYHQTVKTFKALAPHFLSERMTLAINLLADDIEKLIEKIESSGGGFKEIQALTKVAMTKLKLELQAVLGNN